MTTMTINHRLIPLTDDEIALLAELLYERAETTTNDEEVDRDTLTLLADRISISGVFQAHFATQQARRGWDR